MGKRTAYAPGVFNWVELQTTDPQGAKEFYGRLFGWTAADEPVPDAFGGGVYSTLKFDGDAVGSLQEQPADQRTAGIPPHWLSCDAVTDADAVGAKAQELGGTVHAVFDVMAKARLAIIADPIDLPTGSRIAVLADPQGAAFAIFQGAVDG